MGFDGVDTEELSVEVAKVLIKKVGVSDVAGAMVVVLGMIEGFCAKSFCRDFF